MEFDNETYEQINAYISENLTGSSKEKFEERMKSDPAFKKEVDLCRSLKYAVNEKGWFLTDNEKNNTQLNEIKRIKRSTEYKDIEYNLKEVGDQYFQNDLPKEANKKWIYYLSAIVAILCVFLLIKNFTTNASTDTLYVEYSDWKNLPSLTVQSDENTIWAKGERLFFDQQYEQTIILFSKQVEQNENNPNPYILSYLGASYLELNNFESALKVFDQLANSKTIDNSKAYWYKTLVYLKQGNQTKAKEELSKILRDNNNYNFKKAQELLDKLD